MPAYDPFVYHPQSPVVALRPVKQVAMKKQYSSQFASRVAVQTQAVPSTLTFEDPQYFLSFVASLTKPDQLDNVETIHIEFSTPFSPRSYPVHSNTLNALTLILRHANNLSELTLNWVDLPSSVLPKAPAFRLQVFESWMCVDAMTIAFLNSQHDLRVVELKQWGSHLAPLHPYPPSRLSPSKHRASAPPPSLAPRALPNLIEFSGHAEVAAQLVPGRPVQVVNLTSGFEPGTTPEEWEEIMSGLGASHAWVGTLSVGTLESFDLEMLAAISRHLEALEFLYLRVARAPSTQDLFHFDYWSQCLSNSVELEHIEIELEEAPYSSAVPCALPTLEHVRQWHRVCPMLLSVRVSVHGGELLVDWEWSNLQWVNKLRR